MNDGSIVAIFITVLGCFLILAVVFLSYHWRRARLMPITPTSAATPITPPMSRYRVRRGKVVPMSDKNSIISSRSGWASIRPLSVMFASKNANKSEKVPIVSLTVSEPSFNALCPEKVNTDASWWHRKVQDLEAQRTTMHALPKLRAPSPELMRSHHRTSVRSWHKLSKFPGSTIHEDDPSNTSSPSPSLLEESDTFKQSNQRHTFLDPPSSSSLRAPPPALRLSTTQETLQSKYQVPVTPPQPRAQSTEVLLREIHCHKSREGL